MPIKPLVSRNLVIFHGEEVSTTDNQSQHILRRQFLSIILVHLKQGHVLSEFFLVHTLLVLVLWMLPRIVMLLHKQ